MVIGACAISKELRKLFYHLKDELRQDVRVLREILERDFRTKICEIRTGQRDMECLRALFEDMKVMIDAVTAQNAELNMNNQRLQEMCDTMEKELRDQQKGIINFEQHLKRVYLERKGIPKAVNENVSDIVTKIASLVGERIATIDIEACHRVPTKKPNTSHIIV